MDDRYRIEMETEIDAKGGWVRAHAISRMQDHTGQKVYSSQWFRDYPAGRSKAKGEAAKYIESY